MRIEFKWEILELVSPGYRLDVVDGGEGALGVRHQQLGEADGGRRRHDAGAAPNPTGIYLTGT